VLRAVASVILLADVANIGSKGGLAVVKGRNIREVARVVFFGQERQTGSREGVKRNIDALLGAMEVPVGAAFEAKKSCSGNGI
jgi:hypothetical protein